MPVILDTEARDTCLGGSDGITLGAETRLRHHPVSPLGLNDDGPVLIEAILGELLAFVLGHAPFQRGRSNMELRRGKQPKHNAQAL